MENETEGYVDGRRRRNGIKRPRDTWRGDGGETGERERGIRGGETAVKRENENEGYVEGRRR